MNFFAALLFAAATTMAGNLSHAGEAVGDRPACNADNIALGGYDPVSYHNGEPVQGQPDLTASVEMNDYRFASAESRDEFLRDPDRYLPTYNGFCAATLAMGRLACPDYTNYKIEDGRLLLFELAGFTNGRTMWNTDPQGFRQRADDNFTKLLEPGH